MAKNEVIENEIIEEATELVEEAQVAVECAEEVQQVGKGKKLLAGVKKHGKKVVVGTLAVIGGAAVVMKVLSGRKVETEDNEEIDETDDIEITEI